jgi:RNA-directed DNA polymerase
MMARIHERRTNGRKPERWADVCECAVNTRREHEVPSGRVTQATTTIRVEHDEQLMEKIVSDPNIQRAYRRVVENKGAPGVDGMPVDKLDAHLRVYWPKLKQQLLNGTYQSSPVRRVCIPKPDGGVRELGIPTAMDRLIQQAINQVLTPIFDPHFSEHSYGFRPNKSAHQAILQAQEYVNAGKQFVVDIDLEKYFDRVNHDILMRKVFERVKDKRVLKTIRGYLKGGALINGCKVISEEGTPQGGPLSPLLANIMLDDSDKELEKRGLSFVRYADDLNIYVRTQRAGERVMASMKTFLEKRLRLKINEAKSAVARTSKRKFLGFTISNQEKSPIRIAPKSVKRLKDKIRELTRSDKSTSIDKRIKALNQYLTGWSGYFGLAQAKSLTQSLDGWIRMRLRMCLLVLWKKGQGTFRNLCKLGIGKKWAGVIAYSSKGAWRLAHTRQVCTAMGLVYWEQQGLINIHERFGRLQQKLMNRRMPNGTYGGVGGRGL